MKGGMGMNFKKISAFFLALILLFLCGCGSSKTVNLELVLSPNTGTIEKSREVIKVDSGSIKVTAKNIPKGAKIEVYLYDEAHPQDYIQQARLGDVKNEAEFKNLSSSYNYKIGAVLFGTSGNVKLSIKYEQSKAANKAG